MKELTQDLEISKQETKKADNAAARNEMTYHLLKDKSDMLQKELNNLCEVRIDLETEK